MASPFETNQLQPHINQYHVFGLLLGFSWVLSFLLSRWFSKAASLKEIGEPTSVPPLNGVPLFGHLIAILRHGSQYLTTLAYVST